MDIHQYILHLSATNFARTWQEAYEDAQRAGVKVSMLPSHYFCSMCSEGNPCPWCH